MGIEVGVVAFCKVGSNVLSIRVEFSDISSSDALVGAKVEFPVRVTEGVEIQEMRVGSVVGTGV